MKFNRRRNKRIICWSILACIVFISCDYNFQRGRPGNSYSLSESIALGVFEELIFEDTTLQINDTLNLPIRNCWIEQNWVHGERIGEIEKREGTQLIVKVSEEEALNGFLYDWIMVSKVDTSLSHGFASKGDGVLKVRQFGEYKSSEFYVFSSSERIRSDKEFYERYLGEVDFSKPE